MCTCVWMCISEMETAKTLLPSTWTGLCRVVPVWTALALGWQACHHVTWLGWKCPCETCAACAADGAEVWTETHKCITYYMCVLVTVLNNLHPGWQVWTQWLCYTSSLAQSLCYTSRLASLKTIIMLHIQFGRSQQNPLICTICYMPAPFFWKWQSNR